MGCPEKGHKLAKREFELRRTDGAVFRVQVCQRCGIVVMLPELLKDLERGGERGEDYNNCRSYGFTVDPNLSFTDDDDWWDERQRKSTTSA